VLRTTRSVLTMLSGVGRGTRNTTARREDGPDLCRRQNPWLRQNPAMSPAKRTAILAVGVWMLAADSHAQETRRALKPGDSSPPARLEDLAWLQGQWEGAGLTGPATEVYSSPAGGQIAGHFRQLRDGRVWFFEIMAIAQVGPSLEYRLKHFNEDLTG